jgi:hypothetical protein
LIIFYSFFKDFVYGGDAFYHEYAHAIIFDPISLLALAYQ